MTIRLPNNWEPRWYQLPLWTYLQNGGKRAVVIAHRRWGKDDVCLHWAACAAMQRVGNYWHMLPEAEQARKAVWEAVNPHTGRRRIDEAFPPGIRQGEPNSQQMLIRFVNGSTWQVVGSDNYNSLVGSAPVAIVFSEWALAEPMAWAYLSPILAENDGVALFISTPRGRNHAWTFYQEAKKDPLWFAELWPADKTGVFTLERLEREKADYIKQFGLDEGEARFLQEYMCDAAAGVLGAYYRRELAAAEAEGRIGSIPVAPGYGIITAWDIGRRDNTAIWFAQKIGPYARIVDYYQNSGVAAPHYAKILQDKKYIFKAHLMPHDARNDDWSNDMGRMETLENLGLRNIVVLDRERDIHDGINAVRMLLPICYFDRGRCERGLEALGEYRREWDEDRKVYHDTPLHNWASDGADAFRCLARGLSVVDDFGKQLDYGTMNKGIV